jgi:hypothetical protein
VAGSCAGHCREVDAPGSRLFSGQRRRLDTRCPARRDRSRFRWCFIGRNWLWLCLFRSGLNRFGCSRYGHRGDRAAGRLLGHLFVGFGDDADDVANGDSNPFPDVGLLQKPRGIGLDLDHRLVGLDLGDGFAFVDGVALRLDPPHKGSLGHVEPHLGHDHFSGHGKAPFRTGEDGVKART